MRKNRDLGKCSFSSLFSFSHAIFGAVLLLSYLSFHLCYPPPHSWYSHVHLCIIALIFVSSEPYSPPARPSPMAVWCRAARWLSGLNLSWTGGHLQTVLSVCDTGLGKQVPWKCNSCLERPAYFLILNIVAIHIVGIELKFFFLLMWVESSKYEQSTSFAVESTRLRASALTYEKAHYLAKQCNLQHSYFL